MSERVTIGNYQLQLKRTTSALAKNYGKQNLWREIKNIRNADADSIVIGADLRQVAWLNSTATTMADEILSYWNAMDSYIQRQQQQNDSNNHNNNSNNHNNNSTVMVSIEELDDTTIATSVNDNNNQESQEIESETGPVIPPNVPVEYVGWDSTKNYIIYGDGTILYDCRTALNQSHDATQRDKFYHSHKRYVVNQFRNMCEKSHALSILYTINKERLGLAGSVATVMFSPLFYHPKHVEIRLMLSNAMNLGVSQIEERSRLENDINIDNTDASESPLVPPLVEAVCGATGC
eukprot:197541_1